jgi:hypothetical protein
LYATIRATAATRLRLMIWYESVLVVASFSLEARLSGFLNHSNHFDDILAVARLALIVGRIVQGVVRDARKLGALGSSRKAAHLWVYVA